MSGSWVSRLACWLGFHQLVTVRRWGSDGYGYSATGYCIRCNEPWQADL